MREFFDLHCVFESEARTPRRHIRERYVEYCKDVGAEPLGAKRFAEGLRRHGVLDGVVKYAGKVMDGWKGVRLATDSERDRRAADDERIDNSVTQNGPQTGVRARPGAPEDTVSAEYEGESFSDFTSKYAITRDGE
jgi:hypothetical protein